MKKTGIIVGIIIIILIIVLVSGNSNKDTAQAIKIGGVLSLTGAAAQDGESIQKGMELAKADLKAQGVDVELVYQDDATEAKDTVSAINAISTQGVDAIIGPTWSFLGDAGVPVVDRLKIVAVQPANTSEYVSARSPYAFFATTKVERLVPALTKWIKDNNKKTIAVIANQGAWYEAVNKAVEAAAKEAGAKIVFTESVPFGTEVESIPTLIAKLKSAKADLFFFEMDDDKGIATMFKRAQEQGITADIMSVTTSLGRVLASDALTIKPQNKIYVISPELSLEFKNKFTEFYKKAPGAYADRAYDAVMFLVDGIRNKGNMPLNEYLRTKTDYRGFAGTYKFDANGDVIGGEWIIEKLQ